jgi:hypothetical protein
VTQRLPLFLPVLILLASAPHLRAADFEIGPQDSKPADVGTPDAGPVSSRDAKEGLPPADVPTPLAAGDIPTAYGMRKYEMRTDFAFYEGGGILGKAYLGLFPQFYIGGAANVRGFIGNSSLNMTRDDAQLLAKLIAVKEDDNFPGVAIGWDGPAYGGGEAKGLYLALSKEVPTAAGYIQLHGGLNTANVQGFVSTRDLRASAALTGAIRNFGFYTGIDEVLNPVAPRWSLGFDWHFSPITLGLEWQDLASARPGVTPSRLMRVSWQGRF